MQRERINITADAAAESGSAAQADTPTETSPYLNRELSWLAFNRRVLEEALDERNPLLERAKFLAITASNLDEFVEIRVASLLQETEQGSHGAGPDGLLPEVQLERL